VTLGDSGGETEGPSEGEAGAETFGMRERVTNGVDTDG
jgi:hypothetical protein